MQKPDNHVPEGSAEPTEENLHKAYALSAMLMPEQKIGVLVREIKRLLAIPEDDRTPQQSKSITNYQKGINDILASMPRAQRRKMMKPEYKMSAVYRRLLK